VSAEKMDYSLYELVDTWRLNDALDIIINYSKWLASDRGDSEDVTKDNIKKLCDTFDDGTYDFADDVKYCRKVLYIDEYGYAVYDHYLNDEPIEVIDYQETIVNKARFLVWASRKRVPLPDVIVSIIKGSSIKNVVSDGKTKQDETEQFTPNERRKYGLLKLQKDTMDMAIRAAVEIGLFYASLKDGDRFDRESLFNKLTELRLASIPDDSIDLIYQSLPPTHKRKPGEKKIKK
jgi:hypothetical protein